MTPISEPPAPRLVEAEPEVHEDGTAVRREDDVRRLDVAVDDQPGMAWARASATPAAIRAASGQVGR